MSTDDIPGATNYTVSKLYNGIDYNFRHVLGNIFRSTGGHSSQR